MDIIKLKSCVCCKNEKSIIFFGKNKRMNDGLNRYCKLCANEKTKKYRVTHYNKNKVKLCEISNNYAKKNKDKRNERRRKRYHNDILNKIHVNLSNRISQCVLKNGHKTIELIGCSALFLKNYLEKQFVEGMNWENYGIYGWHIDHIVPLSSGKTEKELYDLCHYTNLQPLWRQDNLKKSNKISKEWNNIIV